MEYQSVFGALGVVVGIIGFAFYYVSIFRGSTKPHVFTWFTYVLVDGEVFVAQVIKGAGPGAWVVGLGVAACLGVSILSFWWGEKHITKSDWLVFAGALLGALLWILTSDPLVAVVISSIINILAVIPTIRKSYMHPKEESVSVWSLDILRYLLGLAALASFNLTTALFPAVCVIGNAVLVGTILLRREQMRV